MGVSNITRRFVIEEAPFIGSVHNFNTPSYFMQRVRPLCAFIQGWSKSETDSFDNATLGDALALEADPANVHLYPRTPYSAYWDEVIWPLMINLFESGTGGRYPVSESEVIRYFAHATFAYSWTYAALINNMLAWRFDWSVALPHSPIVPPSIYQLNRDYRATDVGMSQTWLELMQRIEMLILPPSIVKAIQRVLSPMITLGLGTKVIWPFPDWGEIDPWEWTTIDKVPYQLVQDSLDYIDGTLSKTSNLLRSFLPFPVMISEPWAVGNWPLEDPFRWAAMHNASLRDTVPFGHESTTLWPAVDEGLRWTLSNTGWSTVPYHSPVDSTLWGEVQFANIFAVDTTPTIGNDHYLMTPHQYSGYIAPADNYVIGGKDVYLTIQNSDTILDTVARYYKTAPGQRWLFADEYNIDYGFMLPETVVSQIPYEAGLRALRLTVEADWNYNAFRQITLVGMGSSLRELRETFSLLVGAAIQERISR